MDFYGVTTLFLVVVVPRELLIYSQLTNPIWTSANKHAIHINIKWRLHYRQKIKYFYQNYVHYTYTTISNKMCWQKSEKNVQ